MAEVEGLVASIAQTATTGLSLSTQLCDFAARVRHPEQETADIADEVKNISDDAKAIAIALDDIAKRIEEDAGNRYVSLDAAQDAHALNTRCGAVFSQIQHFVKTTDEPASQGTEMSRELDVLKEQKIEWLGRTLEHLKHNITLLLHVLRLAKMQSQGNVQPNELAHERDTIRELHHRQQDSARALQALESKFGGPFLSDDETLSGSAAPSRVPTINFLVHSSARHVSQNGKPSLFDARTAQQAPSALADDSETPDTDDTVPDDDGELLTVHELAQCVNHVQKLLVRIANLHASCDRQPHRRLPRSRVTKIYRRFCRKFESEMVVPQPAQSASVQLPALVSPSHRFQLVHTQDIVNESPRQPTQHTSRILPDPSRPTTDRPVSASVQPQAPPNTAPIRLAPEAHYPPPAPAWTISSEPLGSGSRPKLPPLISTVPSVSQPSPANDIISPLDDQDGKHSGTDGDGEHGSQNGPVVYTKTGRISKAKKGLKVHVCEECGRSFTRAEHLRRHQKNHGPNQVRCELCGKVFFRADLLQRHLERHKDLPQGYRFSNTPAPTTEDASPTAGDEAHHRHILPASGQASSGIPPHHSPSNRSVESSVASGAPTSSRNATMPSAINHQARPPWDLSGAQSIVPQSPVDNPTNHQHAWQTVNTPQERMQDLSDAAYAHSSSPHTIHQSHAILPKLQPKAAQPKVLPTNSALNHKRYSNILPAPGAPDAQQQHGIYPQGHTPNMVPAQYGASPTQSKGSNAPPVHYDHTAQDKGARGPQAPVYSQDGRRTIPHSPTVSSNDPGSGAALHSQQGHYGIGARSPKPSSFQNSPGSAPRSFPAGTTQYGSFEQHSRVLPDGSRTSIEGGPGRFSSDQDGVNWRLAGSDPQSYRQRKHNRTTSQNDTYSSGFEDMRGGSVAQRMPDGTQRTHSGSRSLSLVMPQDERDLALLGRSRQDDRAIATSTSAHGVPTSKALSPALGERRSASRPSTAVSDAYMAGSTDNPGGHGSPEPESPYSLATINRYIKNQGPQPGMNQDEEMVDQDHPTQPMIQMSMTPCERCSEYSIKCDGRLPRCTACATTKYAGECSFATMSAHAMAPMGTLAGAHRPPTYDDMTAMTRQAMTEPPRQTVPPDQGYNSDEDLPSPYLRPRDKEQQAQAMAHISSAPLDGHHSAHSGDKRKAAGEQPLDETEGHTHGRKKSKTNHEGTNGNGKDIVDVLLDQWSVPAH